MADHGVDHRRCCMSEADLVFLGGNVITVDPDDRVAQGVAVAGGRITEIDWVLNPAKLAHLDRHLAEPL
jgi:predicted amidohydrolase YtcJ